MFFSSVLEPASRESDQQIRLVRHFISAQISSSVSLRNHNVFLSPVKSGSRCFFVPTWASVHQLTMLKSKRHFRTVFFYDCVRVSAWSRRCWSYLDKKIQSVGKVAAIVHWIHISHHFVERRKFSVSVNKYDEYSSSSLHQFWFSSQGFSVLTSSCRKKM